MAAHVPSQSQIINLVTNSTSPRFSGARLAELRGALCENGSVQLLVGSKQAWIQLRTHFPSALDFPGEQQLKQLSFESGVTLPMSWSFCVSPSLLIIWF